ncbi:MAG: hypothetical protein ACFE7R_03880 [Candidatus Hodarchaeota archaeon]
MTEAEMTDALEGIKPPEETGKFPGPINEIVFVNDAEKAEVLEDQVRYFIIQVLRRGVDDTLTTKSKDEETGDLIIRQREVKRYALSVVEIVKMSEKYDDLENITKNQVYHHLPKLIEGGYVVKYGTVETGKRSTDYYRRTAKGFVLTVGDAMIDRKLYHNKMEKHVSRLSQVFDIDISEEEKKELTELMIEAIRIEQEGRSKVAKLIRGDVADKEVLGMYEDLVKAYSFGSKRWLEIQQRYRSILLSGI